MNSWGNTGRIVQMLLILLYTLEVSAEGISCFKCYVSHPEHENSNLLCSQFDGSEKFQVYCPSSTLCMKRTIHYTTKTSKTIAVHRDCAPQTLVSKVYKNGEWYDTEEVIKTAYEEGCFIDEDRGTPVGPPEYCFCAYHYCNSAQSVQFINTYNTCLAVLTLLLFNFLLK